MPYVTCIVAEFNLRAHTVVYSNAGHPPGILIGATGTQHLARGGPPAGLLADATYDQEFLSLHAGDICVLVSDGVTEALDGMPLEHRISNGHHATATELCNRFMTEALAGAGPSGDSEWDDDRTVVVMTLRDAHLEQHMIEHILAV